MIELDGAEGEGGGQILRSALSLSICTQQPFRVVNIRANRDKPGLMRQHLTAVRAAAEICKAEVRGDDIGSRELTFRPGPVQAGEYAFAIGTAGSCTLVLQTVLSPLMSARASSRVSITGGTLNRGSPPSEFLQRAFLPLLERMGAKFEFELVRHGFYPRGGGEIRVGIEPAKLTAVEIHERGKRRDASAEAFIAGLPVDIAKRELSVIGKALNWPEDRLRVRGLADAHGPGNAVTVTLAFEQITEVFTGFGERGVRAEAVAEGAARETRAYLAAAAPVGEHLADQLLLPFAIGAGGAFTTTRVSQHLLSNALVIERFTGRSVRIAACDDAFQVRVI